MIEAWKPGRWRSGFGMGCALSTFQSTASTRAMSRQLPRYKLTIRVNDAFRIAHVVRSGWYRPGAIKSLQSCRIRALLSARSELLAIRTTLYNQILGLLKTFGVVLAPGKGGTFERAVLTRCPADP